MCTRSLPAIVHRSKSRVDFVKPSPARSNRQNRQTLRRLLLNDQPLAQKLNDVPGAELPSPPRLDLAVDSDFPSLDQQFRLAPGRDQSAALEEIIETKDGRSRITCHLLLSLFPVG